MVSRLGRGVDGLAIRAELLAGFAGSGGGCSRWRHGRSGGCGSVQGERSLDLQGADPSAADRRDPGPIPSEADHRANCHPRQRPSGAILHASVLHFRLCEDSLERSGHNGEK